MILSRQHALELLTARYGQLISVKRVNDDNGISYVLSRLCKASNWEYIETLLDVAPNYYALCKNNLPGLDFDYESAPSAHKQEYIEYLCATRKVERAKQKDRAKYLHQDSSE